MRSQWLSVKTNLQNLINRYYKNVTLCLLSYNLQFISQLISVIFSGIHAFIYRVKRSGKHTVINLCGINYIQRIEKLDLITAKSLARRNITIVFILTRACFKIDQPRHDLADTIVLFQPTDYQIER